mmetsp:Transcript_3532/g.10049  ORF Transcript_3532/g.10049 Transcript_3532/m.10049 type:complete len:212 (+) Transcript_3532:157-792(+)
MVHLIDTCPNIGIIILAVLLPTTAASAALPPVPGLDLALVRGRIDVVANTVGPYAPPLLLRPRDLPLQHVPLPVVLGPPAGVQRGVSPLGQSLGQVGAEEGQYAIPHRHLPHGPRVLVLPQQLDPHHLPLDVAGHVVLGLKRIRLVGVAEFGRLGCVDAVKADADGAFRQLAAVGAAALAQGIQRGVPNADGVAVDHLDDPATDDLVLLVH